MNPIVGLGFVIVAVGSAGVRAGRRVLERRRARHELLTKPALEQTTAEGTVVQVTSSLRDSVP